MRTKSVLKNLFAGTIREVTIGIIRFILRTVFIYRLSETFLGATSLFTNILNVLNISELGIAAAIAAALYKPLAEGNKGQITALMNLYKKSYWAIGLFILVLGALLMPFLPYIITERVEGLNLYIVFGLYLINSATSYLFLAHKEILLTADQQKYKATFVSTFFSVVVAVFQIIILYFPCCSSAVTFYVYLSVESIGCVARNLFLAHIVNKQYPYINEKKTVSIIPEERKKLFKNIGALSISKISTAALSSTDSIIISAVLLNGLSVIGKYSNYTMLISYVDAVFVMISQSITASLGNFITKESTEKSEHLFDCMHVIFTWIYGICFVCLLCLLNPFIGRIWLSEDWVLSDQLVFLLSINFLLNGMSFTANKYIQSAGLYWQAKFRYIISAGLNIFLSILFGVTFNWGLEGVVFATTIALIGMTCMDSYIVFRYLFQKKATNFYIRYLLFFIGIIATGIIVNYICHWFDKLPKMQMLLGDILVCLILPNALWVLILSRTSLFRNTFKLFKTHMKQELSKLRLKK